MSARATGADTGSSDAGNASQRNHHDGSTGRAFTTEQKTTVIRVRRCSPTAYYDILGLESVKTTCSDSEIKKAYRKLSLLTHPDKNGYDGADEAFKLVSKAFQVLSDADKKSKYDKFGGDPESRHAQAAGTSPFDAFARSSRARPGASMYEDGPEISPEELFRQFFGGGMGGGFPGFAFDTGPQFVFNMGGPGIRVTQFGGQQPRRRPRQPGEPEPQQTVGGTLASLMPLILLFLIPILSSIFSGSGSSGPSFTFDKAGQHTKHVITRELKIPYWVVPSEFLDLTRKEKAQLDHRVEVQLVSDLKNQCQHERNVQEQKFMEAQGWFTTDERLMEEARKMKLKSCERLGTLKNRV